MAKNLNVVVIQNTTYHFETTLSIYKLLEDAGCTPYIYRQKLKHDTFEQLKLIQQLQLRLATKDEINAAAAGVVISAYPNPNVNKIESVPNFESAVPPRLRDKLIFISHRFGTAADYIDNPYGITQQNTFCLSPLAANIGMPYLFPVSLPVASKPEKTLTRPANITAQGHFELNNRARHTLEAILNESSRAASRFQFVGTGVYDRFYSLSQRYKNVGLWPDLKEIAFYERLIDHTDFLMPLIDNQTNNQTYVTERYSSNFNLAWALEKPLFCHEAFEAIYGLPGVYYNYDNLAQKVAELGAVTAPDYANMVAQIRADKIIKQHENAVKIKNALERIKTAL